MISPKQIECFSVQKIIKIVCFVYFVGIIPTINSFTYNAYNNHYEYIRYIYIYVLTHIYIYKSERDTSTKHTVTQIKRKKWERPKWRENARFGGGSDGLLGEENREGVFG